MKFDLKTISKMYISYPSYPSYPSKRGIFRELLYIYNYKNRMPRKVNKKKSRKPRAKKAVQRRAVEVKRRESVDIQIRNSTGGKAATLDSFSSSYPYTLQGTHLSTTSITVLPLRSFLRVSRGDRKNQMTGNQIMSKSIYLKGKLGGYQEPSPPVPLGGNFVPNTNFSNKIYLVTGWLKDTTSYNDFTSPTLTNANRNNVEAFMLAQLKQHFDETQDEMRFREQKKDNIQIDKYQLLTTGEDTQADQQMGIDFKAYWKTNRKVVYSECSRLTGNNEVIQNSDLTQGQTINMTDEFKESGDALGGDSGGFIPNNSWLPFALLYQPYPVSGAANTLPACIYNDIHYFTDL